MHFQKREERFLEQIRSVLIATYTLTSLDGVLTPATWKGLKHTPILCSVTGNLTITVAPAAVHGYPALLGTGTQMEVPTFVWTIMMPDIVPICQAVNVRLSFRAQSWCGGIWKLLFSPHRSPKTLSLSEATERRCRCGGGRRVGDTPQLRNANAMCDAST